jgi:hypothetical protein
MNTQNKRFGFASSSEDPQKLAASVQAIILALASIIILLGKNWGVEITQTQIVEGAGQIGLAVSSIWFVWGLLRKLVVHFTQKA